MIEFKKGEKYWLEVEVSDPEEFGRTCFHVINGESDWNGCIVKTVSWDHTKASKIIQAIEPLKNLILRGEV